MKVIATTKLDLKIHKEEFGYRFSLKRKRGVDKKYWFTPTGKLKIWVGAIILETVGKVTPEEFKALDKILGETHSDAFIYYGDYYTLTGENNISKIINLDGILTQARNEWNERKFQELWMEF